MRDVTLQEFLAARLDEDEAAAWAIHDITKCDALLYEEDMASAARRDPDCDCGMPARVLREVAAKRVILAEHEPQPWGEPHPELLRCPGHGDESSGYWTGWPCVEVLALAAVYSDHPDYDPAWKP